MSGTLYLDGNNTHDILQLEYGSGIALFLIKFCFDGSLKSLPFRTKLVINPNVKRAFTVRECLVSVTCAHSELANSVSRCQLPVFTSHDGLVVHSGLGAVLRSVIFALQECNASRNYTELLVCSDAVHTCNLDSSILFSS